jgi:hypothetical protein
VDLRPVQDDVAERKISDPTANRKFVQYKLTYKAVYQHDLSTQIFFKYIEFLILPWEAK